MATVTESTGPVTPKQTRPRQRRIRKLTYVFSWYQVGYLGLLDESLVLWRIENDDPMEEWESLYDDNNDYVNWEMVHPDIEKKILYLMKRYAFHARRGLKALYPSARIKVVEEPEHGHNSVMLEPDDLLEEEDAAELVMELVQKLEEEWVDAAWADMIDRF